MKAKGFTLVELLLAMSLMGVVLVTGGRLFMHMQKRLLAYEAKVSHCENQQIAIQCFHQDLLRSLYITHRSDSSICLQQKLYNEPICYIQSDSLLLRTHAKRIDTLARLPMQHLHWKALTLVGMEQ